MEYEADFGMDWDVFSGRRRVITDAMVRKAMEEPTPDDEVMPLFDQTAETIGFTPVIPGGEA